MRQHALFAIGSVTSCALSGGLALAEGVTFEPRISGGVSYYEFELKGDIDLNEVTVDGLEFHDTVYNAGAGITTRKGRFFVDLYGQVGFGGDDSLELDVVDQPVVVNTEADFRRYESLATIGYQYTDYLAGFAGFRYAFADWEGDGTVTGVGASEFDAEFEQYGPFFGLSLIFPFPSLRSALTTTGAVTFLNGEVDVSFVVPGAIDGEQNIEGDARGLNLGANWVTAVSEATTVVFGADVSNYDFDDDEEITDFEETAARLRIELRHSFDTGL